MSRATAMGRAGTPKFRVVWPTNGRWNPNRTPAKEPVESIVKFRLLGALYKVVIWDRQPPDDDAAFVPEQGRWLAVRAV